jgi:hypothetical protein
MYTRRWFACIDFVLLLSFLIKITLIVLWVFSESVGGCSLGRIEAINYFVLHHVTAAAVIPT